MSNLLIHEEPLLVLPGLAKRIGLNEALFLQQIHYWLQRSKHSYDGCKWVYNTYEEWQEQFPFWSISTLRRIVNKLEKEQLLIVGNYNKLPIDKTKWYTINYQLLNPMSRPSVQNEQSRCSIWTVHEINLDRPLPETTTEITTETNNISNIIVQIVTYLNDTCKTNYRLSTKKTQTLIKARLKEGFTLEDFKRVIDKKAKQWLDNASMSQYLRPETLFGTKFEGYLNEKEGKNNGINVGSNEIVDWANKTDW